jgi:hypothetical protein
MRFLSIVSAVLWVCIFASDLNAASMYSWTDENGVTNLSNKPPPENSKDIKEYKMYKEGEVEEGRLGEEVMRREPKKKGSGAGRKRPEKPKNHGQEFRWI